MADASLPDIDAMWEFDDPAGTEARLRAALPTFEAAGDADLALQLKTQIARTQSLRRQFDAAHAMLDDVERQLAADCVAAKVRCLLERGRCFNSAGEKARALPLFEQAFEVARAHGLDWLAVDAAHMAAIAETGDGVTAWNRNALKMAQASDQPKARKWLASLYNNIGWTHHAAGAFEEALQCFEQALAQQRKKGDAKLVRIAQWCVARCLRSLGRIEESLAMQRELLNEPERDPASLGYVHEELGECLHALGRTDEARPYFAKAHELLSQDEWLTKSEPARLERMCAMGDVIA